MRNSFSFSLKVSLVTALAVSFPIVRGADIPLRTQTDQKPKPIGSDLFPDRVIVKGKGIEISENEVVEAITAFKSSRAATGQAIKPSLEKELQQQMLEKIIATQLFLQKANEADWKAAQDIAASYIEESKKRSTSEESFKRQLLATGLSYGQFKHQVEEQAIVKAVIDREIKDKQVVTDAQVEKYYNDNGAAFEEPELFKVRQILITTINKKNGDELPTEDRAERLKLAESILAKVKAGEDIDKLAREFSDDKRSKEKGGEITFAKGQMPPEFEVASITLPAGGVSSLVTTRYGYHIIKLIEKIPAKKTPLETVRLEIRENLLKDLVQKELPAFVEKMKKEAGIEVVVAEFKP